VEACSLTAVMLVGTRVGSYPKGLFMANSRIGSLLAAALFSTALTSAAGALEHPQCRAIILETPAADLESAGRIGQPLKGDTRCRSSR